MKTSLFQAYALCGSMKYWPRTDMLVKSTSISVIAFYRPNSHRHRTTASVFRVKFATVPQSATYVRITGALAQRTKKTLC